MKYKTASDINFYSIRKTMRTVFAGVSLFLPATRLTKKTAEINDKALYPIVYVENKYFFKLKQP